jgi:RNA ligase
MDAFLDMKQLDALVESRHLTRRQHREHIDLWIYNYTAYTQFERAWNDITVQCRGLVADRSGKIVARPLRKFFNYDEHEPADVPWHLPFEVTTKLDGSMFLVQQLEDGPKIFATRGSFESDQAIVGWQLFQDKYARVALDFKYTYVFEVIYPENRIVVDYGSLSDVLLLAIINVADGTELPRHSWPAELSWVETIGINTPLLGSDAAGALKALETDNAEGFVVRFENGMRVKIKFDEYKRLHRIVTGVSSKTIWEHMRDGRDIEELLEKTPDEFNAFVRRTRAELQGNFDRVEAAAGALYATVKELPTRKEQALAIMADERKDLAGIVFRMLDDMDYSVSIWKQLQPEYRQPFADRE